MQNLGKLIGIAVTVVFLIALFVLLQPSPIQVEVASISQRPFMVTVADQGRTRARDPYIVAAPITGRLLRTQHEAGDRVQQGQVITQIALSPQDSRTVAIEKANLVAADARLRAEQAVLAEAQGVHARTMRELERREELIKNNLISVEEVDSFRQALIAAEARMESVEAAVVAARANVESVKSRLLGSGGGQDSGDVGVEPVLAPADGTILRILEESERVVQAGTPLFEISNQDRMEVIVDLLTQDAVKVDAGDAVRITGWGGDDAIDGTVRYKEPVAFTKFSALGVEEQRVNVIIDLQNPPPNLAAEYRVEVAITILEFDSVLTVPASSLFQRDGSWNVFAVQAQQVVLRPVEIANRNREYAQVLAGLQEGDTVILYPSDLIEEGTEVVIRQ